MNFIYPQVVAFFLLWCGASLGSADVYYVSANGSCFNATSPCHDFNTYLKLPAQYFQSDTTFIFLPGKHIINISIPNIHNLIDFELVGVGDFSEYSIDGNVKQYGFDSYNMDSTITYNSSSSIIICNIPTFFSFNNMVRLTIANLTILDCGLSSAAAMVMNNINSAIMDGVSIQNSTGYGILGTNVIGESQVARSSFIGNNQYVKSMLQKNYISNQTCNPIIEYWNNGALDVDSSLYMGGNFLMQYTDGAGKDASSLLIFSCLFSLGLNLDYGNSTSTALYGTGLELNTQVSYMANIHVNLTNITSYRNQAYYGAGINIVLSPPLMPPITVENIRMISGVAFYGGGISYLIAGINPTSNTGITQITFSNSIFTNNYAQMKGSSLYVVSQNQQLQNNNSILNISLSAGLITCEVGYSSLDVQVTSSSVVLSASKVLWQSASLANAAVFSGNSNLSSIFNVYQCSFSNSGLLISIKNSMLYSFGCNFSDAAVGIESYFSTVILQGVIVTNSTIQLNDCILVGSGYIIARGQSQLHATSSKLVFSNNLHGAIQLFSSTLTIQNSDVHFLFNSAENGGALYLNQSMVKFIDSSVQFEGNKADLGGAVYLFQSNTSFISSKLQCSSNTAKYLGGCMYLRSSTLSLQNTSSTVFSQNEAFSGGGALFFMSDSILDIIAPSKIEFINNSAFVSGGAMYVQDYLDPQSICFYSLSDSNGTLHNPNILLSFQNNSAPSGQVLYGGYIDTCTPRASIYNAGSSAIFDAVFKTGDSPDAVSSPPFTICKCPMLNSSVCSPVDPFSRPLYPGQEIVISFVATGQRNGRAPAVVLPVIYSNSSGPIILTPLLTENICYNYSIPHYLNGTSVTVVTQSSYELNDIPFSNITITTTLLPCPLGFSLNWTNSSLNNVSYCQCSPILNGMVTQCNVTDVSIQKVTQYVWIGTTLDGTVAYSEYCLQEVCQNSSVFLPEDLTSQCTDGHTGVMCSRCESNLSITLGLPNCQECTNYYLLLLIVFAAMGVIFVALLFVLNLTVFTGTINGLLWYTFVVNINYFIFFNTDVLNRYGAVLFIFAAWFNFDFGIILCFYDGMDMYSYTWLQLAFPTFIFSLIGVIITCANYSRSISKLCRPNAVPVLATLIYISLSKLVTVSVAALSPVPIVSANGKHWMWMHDGNIGYLDVKHIPLAAFALVLLLLVIFPYTALLLFSPWLQRFSDMKCLMWINKLKPFLDNYQAPYKDQFRYWAGATLLFRFILCIITTYYSNDPDVILVTIIVLHVSIILVAGITVYKNWILSMLESFFHINITIMATLLLFNRQKYKYSTAIVVWLGVGSSLLCFVGILAYHIFRYLICTARKPQQNRYEEDIIQAPERDLLLEDD